MAHPFQYREYKDQFRFIQLLFYSSIFELGIGLLLGFLTVYLVDYMVSDPVDGGLGLSKTVYSLTLGLCVLGYMTTTVIAGAFSDNLRSRFGNRIPFIVTGGVLITILLFFGYIFLKNNQDLWVAAVVILVFVSIARGVAGSPFHALMSELFEKDQRGWAALGRTLFATLGTGIAVWTFPPLAEKGEFPEMFLVIGSVFLVSTLLTGLGLPKINPDFPPDETLPDLLATPRLLWNYGRGEFGKLLICQFFWGLATGTVNYFWVVLMTEKLDATAEETVFVLLYLSLFAAICAIPTGFLVKTLGKVQTGVLASILYIIFIFFFMSAADVNSINLITPIGGAAIIGLSTVGYSLPADLVPEGKEGQFFGINTIFSMFPDPITLTIAGLIFGGVFITAINAQYTLLFSIAIFEMIVATTFLLWIEYEGWIKEEYDFFYTRFLRAKNKLPDRTWAGVTFKEYFYKKSRIEEDYDVDEEGQEIMLAKKDEDRIKNKIREW